MQRHARITQEAAFGVFAANGAKTYPRLGTAGSFRMDPTVGFSTYMDGLGRGVQQRAAVTTTSLAGNLSSEIGPANAQFLVGWACSRINSGQTVPWTTAMLPGDLASCTIDFAHELADSATLRRKRNLGVVVSEATFACASPERPDLTAAFSLTGSRRDSPDPDATAFPVPTCDLFPPSAYQLFDLAGRVSVLGTERTDFKSWSLKITNNLSVRFNESRTATMIRCEGRTVSVTAEFLHKLSPDDEAAYEQGTTGACSFEFKSGTNSLKFDLLGNCYIGGIDRDPTSADEPYHTLTVVNQLDADTCSDLVVSFT